MGILLTILYVIGGIIVLFLLIAAFTKKDFRLEKSVVINRSPREVYDFIKLLKNQEKYSVWVLRDPNVKMAYTGIDGTVGAVSSWESNNKHVGVGEQEITGLKDGQSVDVEIRFKKPFEDTNYATTTVSDAGNGQTKVVNAFFGTNKFPKNAMNLMMDKIIGKDMQQNMDNLKSTLEK